MKIKNHKLSFGIKLFLMIIVTLAIITYVILPKCVVQFFPGIQFISKISAKNYVDNINKDVKVVDTSLAFASVLTRVTFEDNEYEKMNFEVYVEPKSFKIYSDTIKASVMDYYLHEYLNNYIEANFYEIDSYKLSIGGDYKWDENFDYKTFYKNLDIKDFNKYFSPRVCNLKLKIKVDNAKDEKQIKANCQNKAIDLQKFLDDNGFKLGSIMFEYLGKDYLPDLLNFIK